MAEDDDGGGRTVGLAANDGPGCRMTSSPLESHLYSKTTEPGFCNINSEKLKIMKFFSDKSFSYMNRLRFWYYTCAWYTDR